MQINTVPDYLPISKLEFFKHIFNVNISHTPQIHQNFYNYTQIYGYSCRALFETIMICYDNPDIKIAITPFHHTSIRDIIEKYVKPENITIIQLNKNYNGIDQFPEIDNCDILIMTHLFGQDLIIEKEDIEKFKKMHNCLIIEDRVQGGTLYHSFSHNYVDIALYSTGMDKRPVALGGGFVNIRNTHHILINKICKNILEYKEESKLSRLFFILKKIPTFVLYNNRFTLNILIKMVNLLSYFDNSISLLKLTEHYRKKNPGFEHDSYLQMPSNSLIKSIYDSLPMFKNIEKLYKKKHNQYIDILDMNDLDVDDLELNIKNKYYPWVHRADLLTAYNAIYIPDKRINNFLEYIKDEKFCVLVNPTYKIFNFEYEGRDKNQEFVDNILYLPSLANMKKNEMKYLANVLKSFT